MKNHPTIPRVRYLIKAVAFTSVVIAAPYVMTTAGDQIAAGFHELQKLEAREAWQRPPAARARQAYVRELMRTHELFEQALREGIEGPRYRATLALLSSQVAVIEEKMELMLAVEAAERRRLVAGPDGELWAERMDEAAARRLAAHRHLTGALAFLNEVMPGVDHREVLEAIKLHFEENPVEVRTFTSTQKPSPYDTMPVRQDVIDISGLRAAGVPVPVNLQRGGPAPTNDEFPEQEPPLPQDLAETLEIVFTPEIQTLAASLDHDPLKIFQHVRDDYEFDPYTGSRRGADETRRLRAGNDMDLSSLLIALLRVSGYPARYATGIVEMSPVQTMNWLGMNDPYATGSILTTVGMEGVTISNGAVVEGIRCRRVWVEAYLPFTDYRGGGNAAGEAAWVPLDPAMKQYDNTFGIDLMGLSGLDADAHVDDYVSTLRAESVVEYFDEWLAAYAAAEHPDLDYQANKLGRDLVRQPEFWLPASLPYRVLTRDATWAEVPANRRFTIRFHIHGEGAALDHTVVLPAIAGKQVTLSYVGATQADRDHLEASGGVFRVPNPGIVKMRPQLRVDGCVVAEGTGEVTLGVAQQSEITFTQPMPLGQSDNIVNTVIAGNYEGHAFATGRTLISSGDAPDTSCQEAFLGHYLHRLGMQYLDRVIRYENQAAALMQMVVAKDVSNAILGQRIRIAYVGGVPQTFDWFGLGVDADRNIVSAFPVSGGSGQYEFMRISGAESSLQENRVFEEEIEAQAVSTIKILALANDAGIPVWRITPADANAYLPLLTHPLATRQRVLDALNEGKHVTIPRDPLTYLSWTGTGYISLTPSTGAAGYIISGGGSGGDTADMEEPPPGCTGAEIISVTPAEPGFEYSACDTRTITIEVRTTSYDDECEITGTSTRQVDFRPASLGPGSHPFNFGADGACGGCATDSVTIIVKGVGVSVADSDGRKASSLLLEVVPPGVGKTIVCEAPDASGEPEWTVAGALNTKLPGKSVNFTAAGWLSSLRMLYDLSPQVYTVQLDNCGVPYTIHAYSNTKGAIQFGAVDTKAIQEVLDALDGVAQKVGSPLSVKPSFSGSMSFENEWKEISGSNRVAYTWTLGGDISAGITATVKFGTGLVGLPPPLAEAAVFVSLGGKIGLKGTASLNSMKQFQVEGGSFGGITVGVGGEVSVASGLISITLVAESGIGFTSVYGGASEPPEVYAQTKVQAGQLDISYKTSAIWGLWEGSHTWQAWEPWSRDAKAIIFPWN